MLLSLVTAVVAAPHVEAEDLVVYTALEDDEYPGYLELFKKAAPDINVKIVRDSTGIVTARLLAEKENPQADVIWGLAATSLLVCDQAGMLEPYAPKDLEKVSHTLRDPANPPRWVGIKAWETTTVRLRMGDTESYLAARMITKRFGRFTALEDVSFKAGAGEFLSILGPSGCGKTTLLRIVAGIE